MPARSQLNSGRRWVPTRRLALGDDLRCLAQRNDAEPSRGRARLFFEEGIAVRELLAASNIRLMLWASSPLAAHSYAVKSDMTCLHLRFSSSNCRSRRSSEGPTPASLRLLRS